MPRENSKTTPRKSFFLLRLLIGVSLLVGLFIWRDNGWKVLDLLSRVHGQYIAALFGIALILNGVSCLKWNLFLKERNTNLSILRLLRLYFIGKFFNNFFPSMIGGDLTRSYLLGRQINSQSQSFASVFLERFTGLIALVFISLIFSVINLRLLREPVVAACVGMILLLCVILALFLIYPKLFEKIAHKTGFVSVDSKLFLRFKTLYDDVNFFSLRYKILLSALMYSFIFYFLASVNVYLSCLSINFYPSFLDIAVVTPIILLVTLVPVSPNNVGWWEWSFSVLLGQAGAGIAQGLAVALILRAISFLLSLAGGMLFLFEKLELMKTEKSMAHE